MKKRTADSEQGTGNKEGVVSLLTTENRKLITKQ